MCVHNTPSRLEPGWRPPPPRLDRRNRKSTSHSFSCDVILPTVTVNPDFPPRTRCTSSSAWRPLRGAVTGVLEQLVGLGARPEVACRSAGGPPSASGSPLGESRRGSVMRGKRRAYLTRRYVHTATPYGIYYISPLAAWSVDQPSSHFARGLRVHSKWPLHTSCIRPGSNSVLRGFPKFLGASPRCPSKFVQLNPSTVLSGENFDNCTPLLSHHSKRPRPGGRSPLHQRRPM